MSDASILFVKPGAISEKDKRACKGAGIIVIEIENPADTKFIRAHAEIESSTLLSLACGVIKECGYNSSPKEAFGKAVAAHLALTKPSSQT